MSPVTLSYVTKEEPLGWRVDPDERDTWFQVNPFLRATRGMFLTALPIPSITTNRWKVTRL